MVIVLMDLFPSIFSEYYWIHFILSTKTLHI
jgi:hypothetical protein